MSKKTILFVLLHIPKAACHNDFLFEIIAVRITHFDQQNFVKIAGILKKDGL